MKPLTVTCKADRLQLFLTKTEGGGWLSSKDEVVLATRKGEIPEEINKLLIDEIDPAKDFADILGAAPTKMVIHVLVVVPRGFLYNPRGPRDSSNEWLTEFFTNKVASDSLPFVGSLSSFVERSLPVKIRAEQNWLDEWKLSPELQEKMFVVDDTAPCQELKSLIFNERVLRPFRRGRSKNSYISTWDSIFRNVLDLLFTQAYIDRYSCNGSGSKRPAFLFALDEVCVFRGEEKSPDVSIRVPTAELCSKLLWTFGSVPYVFGYAASGYTIDLLALHPLHPQNGVVTKTRIGAFNFEVKKHLCSGIRMNTLAREAGASFELLLVLYSLSLILRQLLLRPSSAASTVRGQVLKTIAPLHRPTKT